MGWLTALTPWLQARHATVQAVWVGASAFAVYFGMYAFRKTFKVAKWEGLIWANTGVSLKTAYVLAQLLGYLVSKFIGIKFVSEAVNKNRFAALLILVGLSEGGLVLVGLLPPDWAVIGFFLNGLPLGLVWGLVVSYIEGRKTSDFLLACLCCSFIVSTGYVKDVGLLVMRDWGVSEWWMPAVVGALFFPPYVLACYALHQTPPPSDTDVEFRGERTPMYHEDRMHFFKSLAPGLISFWALAAALTAYRDYRDTFQREIFEGLGRSEIGMFSESETIVGAIVMIIVAMVTVIQSNYWGFTASLGIVMLGALILIAVQIAYYAEISGMAYMIGTGLGSYLGYVPFNSILFERMLSYTGVEATVAFPMQVSDALGYVGVTIIYLVKEFGPPFSYLDFFVVCGWITAVSGAILISLSATYFLLYLPRTSNISTLRWAEQEGVDSTVSLTVDAHPASLEKLLQGSNEKVNVH